MEALAMPSAIVELHPVEAARTLEPGVYFAEWQGQGVLLAISHHSSATRVSGELVLFSRASQGVLPFPVSLTCGRMDSPRWLRPFSYHCRGSSLESLVRTDVAAAAMLLWPVAKQDRPAVADLQAHALRSVACGVAAAGLPCHLMQAFLLPFLGAVDLPQWGQVNRSFLQEVSRLLPSALQACCLTGHGKGSSEVLSSLVSPETSCLF